MPDRPLEILICGAGVAGATLAFTLVRQTGFEIPPSITLIEKSPSPRTTGQAVDIREAGVDVIRKLGLEPAIKARHTTETGISFLNSKGTVAATIAATGDAQSQSATSEYEILRGDLAGLLLEGVSDAANNGADVNVVYGESVESIKERTDGSGVDVSFAGGKLSRRRFDVVVGADGIASKTRSLMFGKDDWRDEIKPSGLYIAFFSIPRLPEDDTTWKWCQIAGGLGMHLRPHRSNKTMGCYLTICNSAQARLPELEDVLHQDIAAQKQYLQQHFKDAGWQSQRFLDGLAATEDFYMSHWCRVVMPKWVKGHCVILGDASFATMGIGTSLAMTGAYCIAGELSKIQSADQVPDALQRYEELFRPYVTKKSPPNAVGMQIANPQTAWGIWIFQTIFQVIAALRVPQLLMRLFGGEGKKTWALPDYGW